MRPQIKQASAKWRNLLLHIVKIAIRFGHLNAFA